MNLTRRSLLLRSFPMAALAACSPRDDETITATGEAFGTEVSITLARSDAREEILRGAFEEIARLERLFTLWEPASPLRRLNREGSLPDPPAEWLELLAFVDRVHRVTGGAFDPTVQPLWELYETHFSRNPQDTAGPPKSAVDRARALIGWGRVIVESDRVALGQPGMALTLNGIAPGYAADRLCRWLQDRGIGHALVDTGEYRALGTHPNGRAWPVEIRQTRPDDLLATVNLIDRGLATSSGAGTPFDLEAKFHHIFDPGRDRFASAGRTVSVEAPEAAVADALATAGVVMPWEAFQTSTSSLPGVRVHQWETRDH